MTVYQAGGVYTFIADYYNEPGLSGVLADPTGPVQVTITYGTTGYVVAGPFPYGGGSTPSPGAVYRTAAGVYAYQWAIPSSAAAGVYVANWQFTDGPENTLYFGEENITVAAGVFSGAPAGETGYWTGSLAYPAAGVSIPFGSVDANGIAWLLKGVDGWDGVPTVGQVLQRAGDHGGYAAQQYYGPRPLTLRVRAAAPTQALRDTARALMQQAVAVSDLVVFTYNEPVPKTAMVRRSGKLAEKAVTLTDVDFTVGLIAPDMRKYSMPLRSAVVNQGPPPAGIAPPLTPPFTLPAGAPPMSVSVANGGNFETRPTVVIQGPVTAPQVLNQVTGQTVSYTGLVLGPTDQLTVDFLNRRAALNGAYRPADITSSWWVMPPGTTGVQLLGTATAGASMTVLWRDAWI
jgi:hypothetical protein